VIGNVRPGYVMLGQVSIGYFRFEYVRLGLALLGQVKTG
jgi:hypothetical protein